MHPFLTGLAPTLLVAHRGGAALAPENTLTAFEAALGRWRADVLELDVHVSRDGEVVVSHDPTLDRCTDRTGAIAALDWSEIARADAGHRFTPDGGRTFPFRGRGVRLPRLAEVLEAWPGARLNVELKAEAPGLEEAVARVLRAARAGERTCLGSASDAAGARLAAAVPEALAFFPAGALAALVMALRTGEPVPDVAAAPWRVLDMPLHWGGQRLVDAPFLAAVAELGLWVNVWTVDDPDEMRRCIAEGVGGVMTDRPDLLRAALDEARGAPPPTAG